MKILEFIYGHAGAISGWLMAAYIHVVRAGGLRKIVADFLGPKQTQDGSVNNQTKQ